MATPTTVIKAYLAEIGREGGKRRTKRKSEASRKNVEKARRVRKQKLKEEDSSESAVAPKT